MGVTVVGKCGFHVYGIAEMFQSRYQCTDVRRHNACRQTAMIVYIRDSLDFQKIVKIGHKAVYAYIALRQQQFKLLNTQVFLIADGF